MQKEHNVKPNFTRRRFLTTVGSASVTILGGWFFTADKALATPTFVRRDVGGLKSNDPVIVSYRKAIKRMRALPTTDPLSWTYQAAIHGTTLSQQLTAWDTCAHGSYFFWSWHRMYLYWFERIIRKMSGDRRWALPYWNWTSPNERHLPAMFRDMGSELYTANRNPAMNNGSGSLPAPHVDYSAAFGFSDFTSASSSLEGIPHGAVHVDVGGWMSSVPTAAQDPIFYLHHSNIDRLWNLWLAQRGSRTDPLSDTIWKNTEFTFFTETGSQVKMTGCEVLRAAQQLRYAYEGEPAQINEYCPVKIKLPPILFEQATLIRLPGPEVVLGSEPVSIPFEVTSIRERIAAVAESKNEKLLLELENVEAERQPGVVWSVFVGLPVGAKPDSESPYHVGNLALFGAGIRSEAHHEFKPAHFIFVINRAIQASLTAGDQRLLVTFIPEGILIDGKPTRPELQSTVRIGNANLLVRTEKNQ
jgi:hypothetical protein